MSSYITVPSQCWPHRYSTRYEQIPTCLDCGGEKCNTRGCDHLAWSHSEGGYCPSCDTKGYIEEVKAAVVNQDAESAFDAWLWYRATMEQIVPRSGGPSHRRTPYVPVNWT